MSDPVSSGRVCDFCCAHGAAYYYPCASFVDDVSGQDMMSEWFACLDCSWLIEEKDLRGLVERAVNYHISRYGLLQSNGTIRTRDQVKNHAYQIYVKFWNHRKGDRVSWPS